MGPNNAWLCVWLCLCVLARRQPALAQKQKRQSSRFRWFLLESAVRFVAMSNLGLSREMMCGSRLFMDLPHVRFRWIVWKIETIIYKSKNASAMFFKYKVPLSVFNLQKNSVLFNLKSNFLGFSKIDMNMLI